jgi:hypothetical protein
MGTVRKEAAASTGMLPAARAREKPDAMSLHSDCNARTFANSTAPPIASSGRFAAGIRTGRARAI